MNNLEMNRKITMLLFAICIAAKAITLSYAVYKLTDCEPKHRVILSTVIGALTVAMIADIVNVCFYGKSIKKTD